jgi:hypothetical protein
LLKVPALLKCKAAAPPAAAAECDETLRQWAGRVKQMGNKLKDSKGPALDMLLTFSNM